MSFIYQTANEAWEDLFKRLLDQHDNGFRIPSRAGAVVGEILNAAITIKDATRGWVDSPIRNLSVRYAVGELMWYLSGSNMLRDIEPFSKFWKNLSDDGDTLNSAYGHRIKLRYGFDQWEYCKDLLWRDPNSRQAVIHIKDANDSISKDVPCTVALQYQIREGNLHASTFMRSNDIWLGFPFDVFCFTAFQMKMAMELGVGIGTYTHFVGSLHLYEKDVKRLADHKNTSQNTEG